MPLELPFVFTPTKDFESAEFRSVYLKGMSYTVRPGNTKLQAAVTEWLADGSVIAADAVRTAPKGAGTVG